METVNMNKPITVDDWLRSRNSYTGVPERFRKVCSSVYNRLQGETLTLSKLVNLDPGIIASGNDYCHTFKGDGRFNWIAIRGEKAIWAIFVGPADVDHLQLVESGTRIKKESTIKKLVPCDWESFMMYLR